jgi:hypothetical protein
MSDPKVVMLYIKFSKYYAWSSCVRKIHGDNQFRSSSVEVGDYCD